MKGDVCKSDEMTWGGPGVIFLGQAQRSKALASAGPKAKGKSLTEGFLSQLRLTLTESCIFPSLPEGFSLRLRFRYPRACLRVCIRHAVDRVPALIFRLRFLLCFFFVSLNFIFVTVDSFSQRSSAVKDTHSPGLFSL